MVKKELLKELIITAQRALPHKVMERELTLPINSNKVITVCGVRRCGKSSLLYLTMNELLKSGISPEKILFLNFDDERLQFEVTDFDLILQAYRELFPYVLFSETYLFFDEIQIASGWESFIRRVYDTHTKNIFITGSNSKMLSSEIATSLRGRTLQYEVFPLSFGEYCHFLGQDINFYDATVKAQLISGFSSYVESAFPELVNIKQQEKLQILQEYYYVMLYRDLIERYNIQNNTALTYFTRRIMANITKPTSINKIHNELKSAGISVGKNSLYEWANHFESIYMFMPLYRFEPSMVKQLSNERKFYCIDNGLRRALIHSGEADRGILLENSVHNWLRSKMDKSRQLFFYKDGKECDFVLTEKGKVVCLIQVSWQMSDPQTFHREVNGLLEASNKLKCDNLWIITADTEDEIIENNKKINVKPAWKATLMNNLFS